MSYLIVQFSKKCVWAGFGFGQQQQQQQPGTRHTPYNKHTEAEGSGTSRSNVNYVTISCLPAYNTKSPEELRWEDYQVATCSALACCSPPGMLCSSVVGQLDVPIMRADAWQPVCTTLQAVSCEQPCMCTHPRLRTLTCRQAVMFQILGELKGRLQAQERSNVQNSHA